MILEIFYINLTVLLMFHHFPFRCSIMNLHWYRLYASMEWMRYIIQAIFTYTMFEFSHDAWMLQRIIRISRLKLKGTWEYILERDIVANVWKSQTHTDIPNVIRVVSHRVSSIQLEFIEASKPYRMNWHCG